MLLEEALPWGSLVALALYLEGLGGGAFVVAAATSFISGERFREVIKFGAYVGLLATALCTVVLPMHAGHPERMLFMYSNPTSMMTFGTCLITAILPIGLIYATFLPPDSLPWLKSFLPWSVYVRPRKFFEAILLILGSGLAGYSGLLLGVAWAQPFWGTPLMVVTFFLSAASVAIMAIGLCIAVLGLVQVTEDSRRLFTEMMYRLNEVNACVLAIELVAALSHLYVALTGPSKVARESAMLLYSGGLAPLFWGGFVFVGVVIPIALAALLLALRGRAEASVRLCSTLTILSSVCVLVGGFLIKHCFLMAGQVPVFR